MTNFRTDLLNRMIKVYGFENNIVIWFSTMCEQYEANEWNDNILRVLVESHEAYPQLFNEE